MRRHSQILNRGRTALLIVDVQERIHAVMLHKELIVDNISRLIKACKILNVPIFITEQYPRGLGTTVPAISDALADLNPVQKLTFSCCGATELMGQLKAQSIQQIIVTGIESHVCVQQTALDLIAQDFQVHIPKDAVSSRKELDYLTALERMSKAGVVVTTLETALFELLEKAGTDEFKEVMKLIK